MTAQNGNTSSPRVWFITGCSTGLGRAFAEAIITHGDDLIATARDADKVRDLQERAPERALAVPLDVTRSDSIRRAIDEAVKRFGRIDVLVNNAGYGLQGALEELTDEEIREQFETNVFGLFDVTRAVLPFMRRARSGHIINISSVGGFVGREGFGAYNASKFAVEGMSEALAGEVAPLGINVTIVEPGGFRTDWAGRSLHKAQQQLEDYAPTSGRMRRVIEDADGKQQGDPRRAAAALIRVVESEHPPLRLVLGTDAIDRIREKLNSVAAELDAWEDVTRSTAFDV